MMEPWIVFVEKLEKIDFLKKAKDNVVSEWGSELPMLIFSSLGRAIVKNFDVLSFEARVEIFNLIEKAVTANNSVLAECVSTGLLEALDDECCEDVKLSEEIHSLLGDESRKYLASWNDWNRSRGT